MLKLFYFNLLYLLTSFIWKRKKQQQKITVYFIFLTQLYQFKRQAQSKRTGSAQYAQTKEECLFWWHVPRCVCMPESVEGVGGGQDADRQAGLTHQQAVQVGPSRPP